MSLLHSSKVTNFIFFSLTVVGATLLIFSSTASAQTASRPDQDDQAAICPRIVKQCPDGSSVVPNPWNNCEIPECPDVDGDPDMDTEEDYLTPDGEGIPDVAPGRPICVREGCNGTLCVESGTEVPATNCRADERMGCFQDVTCERQADGQCGFTEREQIDACIAEIDNEDEETYIIDSTLPTELRTSALPLRVNAPSQTATLDVTAPVSLTGGGYAYVYNLGYNTETVERLSFAVTETEYDTIGHYAEVLLFDADGQLIEDTDTVVTTDNFFPQERAAAFAVVRSINDETGSVDVRFDEFDPFPAIPQAFRPNIDDNPSYIGDRNSLWGRHAVAFNFSIINTPIPTTIQSINNAVAVADEKTDPSGAFAINQVIFSQEIAGGLEQSQGEIKLYGRCQPLNDNSPRQVPEDAQYEMGAVLEKITAANGLTTGFNVNNRPLKPGRQYLVVADSDTQINLSRYYVNTTFENPHDLTGDDAVDISDFSILRQEYLSDEEFLSADYNCDDIVDIQDYSLFRQGYSQ